MARLRDVSPNGAPLPWPGWDFAVSGASQSYGVRAALTGSESVLHELLQQQVCSSNHRGSFSLQQLITFVFCPTFRINSPISRSLMWRGNPWLSLCGKRKGPLLLKRGAQSATCLTCKRAAGAPGRFSLAENLNKSYSVENPKGWREGREMRGARGIENKDHFRCERPCERSPGIHTHTRAQTRVEGNSVMSFVSAICEITVEKK